MSLVDTLRNTLVPVHKEGYRFIAIFFVVSLVLGLLWEPLMWIGFLLTAWCAYFFRDPERMTPIDDDLVISPAPARSASPRTASTKSSPSVSCTNLIASPEA